MVTQTAPRTPRVETPARWRAALERAIAAGIEPLQIAGTGEWVVTSATRLGTVYRTDGTRCECAAAQSGNPICQHRAAVRFVLGWGPLPAPPAAVCRGCAGRGFVADPDGRQAPERCFCRPYLATAA